MSQENSHEAHQDASQWDYGASVHGCERRLALRKPTGKERHETHDGTSEKTRNEKREEMNEKVPLDWRAR